MSYRTAGSRVGGDDYDLSDAESQALMSNMKKQASSKPDWSRFGLSHEQQQESQQARENPDGEEVFDQHTESEKNELFAEDQVRFTPLHVVSSSLDIPPCPLTFACRTPLHYKQ